jgi:ubiquinone/menaquinone biosynthesis C-methylase UbiE
VKTKKELAYLFDLCVAPDWGERFAALLDENVKLPERGRALYVACGTGGHALSWAQKAAPEVVFVCVEEDAERLELARSKAATLKVKTQFRDDEYDNLDFPDEHFALVAGDLSMLPAARVPEIFRELSRVTAAGGALALALPTAGSYGEFFSLYWEALFEANLDGHEHDAEDLITGQPTLEDVIAWAQEAQWGEVKTDTRREEFAYESGAAFINAPLVADFLLPAWCAALPDETTRSQVIKAVARLADEDRHGADVALTVKATLVTGRKSD